MLLLKAKKINKWYGPRQLLKDISFEIYKGDKIGLVGRNGTGKSTLFKILMGKDDDYTGNIKPLIKIGYLPQYYQFDKKKTVESFLTKFSYDYGLFMKYMRKFGLSKDFLDRKLNECSGGEQTKIQLIKLLVQEAGLLILDEPTNHLDIGSMNWLKDFINKFTGAVLIVSHDRYFLDKVVNQIWELEDGEISRYSGNYSSFTTQKKKEKKYKQKEYEKYQAEKKKLKEAIRRQKQYVNKSDKGRKRTDSFWRELKGQDRRNGQFAQRVNSLESQLEQLEEKPKPYEHKEINMDLVPREEAHSNILIRGKNVSKSFSDKTLFSNIDFTVEKGTKIGLIGKNGVGKTILLKLILGKETLSKGDIFRASSLNTGYFSQKLVELNPDNNILEELKSFREELEKETIRTFLGVMLFSGKEVFKKISDLSIGERVRVCFTKLLLSNSNLLVLDEPLNHLDISSRENIEKALGNYPGTVIFVTHDQVFLKNVATNIWELVDNNLICFQGNYEEYREYKNKKRNESRKENSKSNLVIQMKKAELIAKLNKVKNEKVKQKIEEKIQNPEQK
ncbi:MAG: ribosomal protection-like ABC-F family protein [Bacillota bacterium]